MIKDGPRKINCSKIVNQAESLHAKAKTNPRPF